MAERHIELLEDGGTIVQGEIMATDNEVSAAISYIQNEYSMNAIILYTNMLNANSHASFQIKTSRYNALSFVPRALFEQFRRIANMYFLVLGAIMLIGQYTGARWTG
jgi:hypothetical protein